jgi:hypothetical protein
MLRLGPAAILRRTVPEAPAHERAQRPERITLAVAASDRPGPATVSRREVFLLAAVLAGTALTGAAAVAGLKRSAPAQPSTPQIGQTITPQAPAATQRVEPGD